MSQSDTDPRVADPSDPTIDAPSPFVPSRVKKQSAPRVHLAFGTQPELSKETDSVLRSRLRIAALTLAFAFAVFLIWHVINYFTTAGFYLPVIAVHAFVTFALILSASMLCRRCEFSSRTLRTLELIVFSLPAIFFMLWHYVTMVDVATAYHVLPYTDGMWLMLLFVYALFIPNNWKRASMVIGTYATFPVILSVYLYATNEACANAHNAGFMYFSQLTLKMVVGTVTAVVAVYTIGALRREAFEAKQLGQYKLREKLGVGGMGEVYLGEHEMMKRPCAIKMIRTEKAGDPKTLARFEREVQTTARLSHWNNIAIYDYGRTDDGTFYYVMEYLRGMDLKILVDRFGPLPPERAIYLLRQICDALNEAHGIGLIHRDIKPGNLIAAKCGGRFDVAKLLDFGLAKPHVDLAAAQITQEGRISGSPLFMSPEQVTNDTPADERSDIYSVGTVAYYLLTGRAPFDNINPMKVMIAHVNERPKPTSELNALVPADLESVVMRCLEKQPEKRFQSAMELRESLDSCADADGWSSALAEQWWQNNVDQPKSIQKHQVAVDIV